MSPIAPKRTRPVRLPSVTRADEPTITNLDRPPGGRKNLEISYQLRLADLYWMWETSGAGLVTTIVFVVLALVFLSAPLSPGDKPVGADIETGIACLLLAPFLGPAVMLFASGKMALRGRTVRLVLDEEGLDGWSVPSFRETTWGRLRHPRLESRVLVLPFSWPFADSWAVVPARAFTPAQFEHLMAILEGHGFFREGDRRSLLGRMLSLIFDRPAVTNGGTLARFPTFGERHGIAPLGRSAWLRNLDRRMVARRLLVVVGSLFVFLAVMTDPPAGLRTSHDQPTTFFGSAGSGLLCFGIAWYSRRSRRAPRLVRFAAIVTLLIVAIFCALVSLTSFLVPTT
jgi:hypothetical protein